MPEQLYRRIPGKRVRYEPVTELAEKTTTYDLNDAQCLTVAGTLGVTLLGIFERHIPSHKRNARKIKAVESAVLDLFQGSGQEVDMEVCNWVCTCWDRTMKTAEGPGGGANETTSELR